MRRRVTCLLLLTLGQSGETTQRGMSSSRVTHKQTEAGGGRLGEGGGGHGSKESHVRLAPLFHLAASLVFAQVCVVGRVAAAEQT